MPFEPTRLNATTDDDSAIIKMAALIEDLNRYIDSLEMELSSTRKELKDTQTEIGRREVYHKEEIKKLKRELADALAEIDRLHIQIGAYAAHIPGGLKRVNVVRATDADGNEVPIASRIYDDTTDSTATLKEPLKT